MPVLRRPPRLDGLELAPEQASQEHDAGIGARQTLAAAICHDTLSDERHVVLCAGQSDERILRIFQSLEQCIMMIGRVVAVCFLEVVRDAPIDVRRRRGYRAVAE